MEESQDSYSRCSTPATPALQSTKNTQPFGIRIVYFPVCKCKGLQGGEESTRLLVSSLHKLWLCTGNISVTWEADEKWNIDDSELQSVFSQDPQTTNLHIKV